MPSAVWSGTISFSLVSVPVQLYPTVADTGPTLHNYHEADGGRIRTKRVCEVDGQEVAYTDIARGIDVGDSTVVITDADLDELPLADRKVITIDAFVPEEQIDPIAYRRAYYVVPEKPGIRPYALLRNALRKAGRAAVVTFAMRERESLALLRAREDNMIVLESLYWPDEVRQAPAGAAPEAADADEVKAMMQLVDAMTKDFRPADYQPVRVKALEEVIEAKIQGREVKHPPQPKTEEAAGRVTDLMAALRASVDAAKRSRPEEEPKPARKRAKKAA